MQGVRLPDDQAPKRAGEYSWMSYDRERRFWPSTFLGEGEWQLCGPDGRCGAIRATKEKPQAHTVTVHEDGTITVSPSLVMPSGWHGWLLRGVWS
jgi:hypothetical protein